MPEQVADRLLPSERDRGDARPAPVGSILDGRLPAAIDRVAERLERLADHPLAPGRMHGRERRLQGPGLLDPPDRLDRAPRQGRAEGLAQGDAQEAPGDVRPVGDVPFGPQAPPGQGHGIDLDRQRRGAAIGPGLGEEDPGHAEAQLALVEPVGMLAKQVAEVGRPLARGRDRQEHRRGVPPGGRSGRVGPHQTGPGRSGFGRRPPIIHRQGASGNPAPPPGWVNQFSKRSGLGRGSGWQGSSCLPRFP